MAAHGEFDRIGDHFAADQRGFHALVAHRDAVGHRDGGEFTRRALRLGDAALDAADDREVRSLFTDPAAYNEWAVRWRQRLSDEPQDAAARRNAMRSVNPAFIPRNHRVEAVIQAAMNHDDFAPFEELLTVLSKPYEDQPAFAAYAEPPLPDQRVLQTFCGT